MSDQFDDHDEYGDEEEEEYQSSRRWLQPFILIIALILIIAMAGVPVARIFSLMEDSDSETVEERARRNTALLFAESVLQQRSTSRAEPFIEPSLSDEVDAIVGELQSREPASLDNTSVNVRFARCSRMQVSGDECFEATLGRDGEPPVMTIQYAVEIVNNTAIVVAVNRPGIRI